MSDCNWVKFPSPSVFTFSTVFLVISAFLVLTSLVTLLSEATFASVGVVSCTIVGASVASLPISAAAAVDTPNSVIKTNESNKNVLVFLLNIVITTY